MWKNILSLPTGVQNVCVCVFKKGKKANKLSENNYYSMHTLWLGHNMRTPQIASRQVRY